MPLLPPLANAILIREESPAQLRTLHKRLSDCGEFDEVFCPQTKWICGIKKVGHSTPEPPDHRRAGLVLLEGLDRIKKPWEFGGVSTLPALDFTGYEKLLRQTPGDFSFFHFAGDDDLRVVRSVAGFVPIYYWKDAGRIAFATRLIYLPRFAGSPAVADRLVYAMWAWGCSVFPDGRTPLKDIVILPGGTYTSVLAGDVSSPNDYSICDKPERRLPTSRDVDDYASRVRESVLQYLDENLSRDRINLCSLSGGVDSSTVTALAARTFSVPVAAWSWVPGWEPDRSRELSYIDPLLDWAGVTQRLRRFIDATSAVDLIEEYGPTLFPVILHSLLALPGVVKNADVGTVLGGEFADEAFGGLMTPPDISLISSLADAFVLARKRGGRSLARFFKHRALWLAARPLLPYPNAMPKFFSHELRAEYRQWLFTRRKQISQADPTNYYLRASLDIFYGLRTMDWEVCSPLGIRRLTPFFHREIVQAAFATHPYARLHDGVKTLLRRAFIGLVPDRNLNRPDKGPFTRVPRPSSLPFSCTMQVLEMLDVSVRTTPPALSRFGFISATFLQNWLAGLERATF